jgi:hypothetical protein
LTFYFVLTQFKLHSQIKLTECELQDLVFDGYNDKKFKSVFFFIKDVEDEFGDKLLKTE